MFLFFFFSSRRRHTRCALVTGVQTCALPIYGETSQEHFLFAYEPRVQINDKAFTYGLVQYERDPIIGFDNRYTASAGIGYDYIRNDRMRLSLDYRTSFCHMKYTNEGNEDRAGIRFLPAFNLELWTTHSILPITNH